MKKREITNKELEQLFNKLVEQKPLLNEEQAALLLNKLPTVPSQSAFNRFFQSKLNVLIVGSIIMILVIGSILWMNNNGETENTIQPNQPNQPQQRGNEQGVGEQQRNQNKLRYITIYLIQ